MIHIQMYMFGVVIEFSKTNGSTWKTYEARMHSVPTRELDFYTNGAQCPVQKLNALPFLSQNLLVISSINSQIDDLKIKL